MSSLIAARNGFGSLFSWSSIGSTGAFTALANVLNINPPSFTRGTVDITNHGTTDAYEQAISGGIIRSGEVSFTAVYLSSNAQQTTLIPAAFNAGTRCGWLISVAGTSSNNCLFGDGYITSYQPFSVPQEGRVEFTASIKITGMPTFGGSTTT